MGSPVSTFTYLPGSLKSLLQGGLRFDASEEYLEFRFRVLNAVMITGVLFTAIFILIDWAGLNSLGHGQLLATEVNCVLTAGLVFMLRGRKERFGLVAVLFVAINYATFLSALLLVVNDELRVIWFFVAVVVIYILLGCVMDSLAMILLTIPIFYPMVMGLEFFGMSVEDKSIWFGILALMVVEIGLVHPPVGMNLYVINKIAKDVPMKETALGVMPFLASDFIRIIALVFFPTMCLGLVHFLG